MTNFATKVAQIGSKWPVLVNLQLFPQKVAQIDLEWPILPDSQLFPIFPTKAAHFAPNFKIFIFGGVYISQFSEICNFLNCFPNEVAQNDPQQAILPPKLLGLAQNGQFWSIFNFSLKKWLRLTWNGQFCLIPNFSQYFPPSSPFCTKFQNFHFWGVYIGQFSEICNFLNCFQMKWLKMTHNRQFCHQSGLDWLKMANFGQFSTFPQKVAQIDWNGQFHPIHNFSNLFPTKWLILHQISKFSF